MQTIVGEPLAAPLEKTNITHQNISQIVDKAVEKLWKGVDKLEIG